MSRPEGLMEGVGPDDSQSDLDAVAGRVIAELLSRSHVMRPADVSAVLTEAALPLGVSAARIYLVDLQQRELTPLPAGEARDADTLPVDSTLAGRAYQTVTIQVSRVHGADGAGTDHQVWIPLVDGTARLGVLSLTVADVSQPMLDCYRALASLAGLMVEAKTGYSDTYAQTQRSREMALQAELIWAFLPPRTFATDRVLVSASLEPAYDAGGDAFDYSLLDDHLHVSIFDALGHDLSAGMLASVGIASCRSTRRAGGSLADIAARADHAIADFFGDERFVTALLCDLDVGTGLLTWVSCGHPPPLLIRSRTVKELARPPRPPLGLGSVAARWREPAPDDAVTGVWAEKLEPGDRVLLYTDGVTEGRAADGALFGLQRLADFIIRHNSASLPAPETLRRLNRAIVDYQQGQLRDDATAVLIEWQPDHPGRVHTP
ncbi:MAG TPA: PP2C family protein-serine/threonine phosphatase [Trebonia sp.]